MAPGLNTQSHIEPQRTPTILIVEDDYNLRKALRYTLVHHGYSVLDAPDSAAAVVINATYPEEIDLVLADLDLPSSTGVTVVTRLRLHRPELRFIYMTGHSNKRLSELGFDDLGGCVLHKPVPLN